MSPLAAPLATNIAVDDPNHHTIHSTTNAAVNELDTKKAEVGSTTPSPPAVSGAAGSSIAAARADHVHPLLGRTVMIAGTSIGNSTTETVLATHTIPAGSVVAGTTYRVTAGGNTDNQATSGTMTVRLRVGGLTGTVVASYAIGTVAGANTALSWWTDILLTFREAADSATEFASTGFLRAGMGGTITSSSFQTTSDMTAARDIVLTAQWATASATNVFRCNLFMAELVN